MIERLESTRAELAGSEQFVLVVAALSPIAWAPVFLFHSAPRVALALVLLPLGVLSLVRQARDRDAASIVALMLSVAAVVSACLSPAPLNSLMGSLDWWTGALGLVTALAWWALGRELSSPARRLLIPVLTVGALWNVIIALAQIVLEIDTGTLAAFPGRGSGTMLNPVYYGAFMSGILACWLMLSTASRRSAVLVLALSFGVGLSGGRIAVGIAVVVGVASLAVRSQRWIAARNLALMLAGIWAATLMVPTGNQGAAVTARVARAGVAGGGGGVRRALWRVAIDAVLERPVLGWGQGNIEIATERQFDLEYTRGQLASVGRLLRWTDTHNVVLNLIVGVGLLGGALALVFVGLSIRGFLDARHDLLNKAFLAGAFAMAGSWMLQPSTIHTVPIALLLLGASTQRSDRSEAVPDFDEGAGPERSPAETPKLDRRVMTAGVCVGAVLLCNLLILDRAVQYGHLDVANAVGRYGYSDPFVDDLLAAEHRLAILDRDRDEMLVRAAWFADRQLGRYPVHHAAGVLGELRFIQGNPAAALAAERQALQFQPWNPLTHRRLLVLAEQAKDDDLYDSSMRVLCLVGADACDETGEAEGGALMDDDG